MDSERRYSSGEIVQRYGIVKNTLFKWEREGRIPKAFRDWRGYRYYTSEHVAALNREIKNPRYLIKLVDEASDERAGRDPARLRAAYEEISVDKIRHGDDQGLWELKARSQLTPATFRKLAHVLTEKEPLSPEFFEVLDLTYQKAREHDPRRAARHIHRAR